MDNEPLQPDRFLEALDVCRSGSGDLGDPHLAPWPRPLRVIRRCGSDCADRPGRCRLGGRV